MKAKIHLIPTDKPSRLVQRRITKELKFSLMDNPQLWNNINIYITSDEEIKEGDWYYDLDTKYVKIKQSWENSHLEFNSKKIILTTDVDLIKDGVQAIDDEFLEWFVKNPSCEEVKFELQIKSVQLPQEQLSENSYGLSFRWMDIPYYKIIIPKEQSCSCTDECLGYLTKTCKRLNKYEEEKLYSRKDVLNLLDFVNDRLPDLYSRFNPEEELEEWHKFEIVKEVSNEQ